MTTIFKEWTYDEVVTKSEHLKALGMDEIYLSKGPFPWASTYKMEPSGSHRLDITTSIWFYATCSSGIKLIWTFDIENREANGKGYYEINQSACREVMELLPVKVKRQFRKYLAGCADAVEKNAEEYQEIVNNELATVKMLREI